MLDRYDQDLLLDYLEDELDAGRRAQMDAMLAEDPQLAALLHEMALDRAALRALPHAEAPAGLVHDVTQTLERRMLLDEPVEDLGPIPMSRGRGLTGETPSTISWGRIVGLTGLAAAVALAASIVVITLDDPLMRTADELAASMPGDTEAARDTQPGMASTAPRTDKPDELKAERFAEQARPNQANDASIAGAVEGLAIDLLNEKRNNPLEDALALAPREDAARGTTPPNTLGPVAGPSGEGAKDQALASLGTTALISATQPRQQLVLFSESPQTSLEELVAFCVANGIPVVQPDESLQLMQRASLGREKSRELSTPADEAADADQQDLTGNNYALLINEAQLNTLVLRLNNDVTLEPKRAGKASLFSNQAALIEELPEEGYGLQRTTDQSPRVAANPVPQANESDTLLPSELARQQAIQLRSPDLGSTYANERNAYNLNVTNQIVVTADYDALAKQTKLPAAAQAPVVESAPAAALAEADRPESEPLKADADAVAKEKGDLELNRHLDTSQDKLAEDEAELAAESPATRINPTRGNWLFAHLPAADTTPLLLNWRASHAAAQTELVPVTIQRAAPEEVNSLRLRQQVELNRRLKQDALAEPPTQVESANEAAESQPAAPAEPAAETDPDKTTE